MIKHYIISLDLSETDKIKYQGYTDIIKDILDLFKDSHKLLKIGNSYVCKSDFEVIMGCYKGMNIKYNDKDNYVIPSKFRELIAKKMGWSKDMTYNTSEDRLLAKWNPNNIKIMADQYMDIVRKRQKLFSYNKTKSKAVYDILLEFKTKTIILNEDLQMADFIEQDINQKFGRTVAFSLHSKSVSKQIGNPIDGEIIMLDDNSAPRKFGKATLAKHIKSTYKDDDFFVVICGKSIASEIKDIEFNQCICTSGNTLPFKDIKYNTQIINNHTKLFTLVFDIEGNYFSIDYKALNKRLKEETEISDIVWLNSITDIKHI